MRKQRPRPPFPTPGRANTRMYWIAIAVGVTAWLIWILVVRLRSPPSSPSPSASSDGYPLSQETLHRALILDEGLDRPLKDLSGAQLVQVLMRALTRIQNRSETEQEESKAQIEQLASDPAQREMLRFMLTKLRTDEFFVDLKAFCTTQFGMTLPECTPDQLVTVRGIPLCVYAHAVASTASPDVLGALAIFQIRLESILDGRPVAVTVGVPDLIQRMNDRLKTVDASTCARCDPS